MLGACPKVKDVAVIGLPDEKWGERVHAVVVKAPSAELDEAALIRHCQNQLSPYKCPRSVSFIDAMPLSPAGKILKTELRTRLSA